MTTSSMTVSEADRLHRASLALFGISRVLRENIEYSDAPGGCPLSVRDQHGLLLAAEYISECVYSAVEFRFLELQDAQGREALL